MKSDVEQAIRAVVGTFEEAFVVERAGLNKVATPWRTRLESQAFLLGPMSVLRAAREERSFDRLANRGFANVFEASSSPAPEDTADSKNMAVAITNPHLGSAVARVFSAVRASNDTVPVHLGPQAKPLLREVLAPLETCGAITIDAAAPDGVPPVAAVLVAAFYYAKHDLERLVTHLALELAMPCPLADGGVELFLPSRWDQRWVLIDRLEAARALLRDGDLDVRPLTLTIVDAQDTVSFATDVAQALKTRRFGALSTFVYPMLEESTDVGDAFIATSAACEISIKNGRPSFGFWAGQGRPCRVEVPQILRAAPPSSWCERRCNFERVPTMRGAASSALSNAIPSALLP